MKASSCSHKLSYKEYLELICRYLLDDTYIELACIKKSYEEITYVHGKDHMIVV